MRLLSFSTQAVLRLLRVFRIFKLMHFVAEYQAMGGALLASRRKILVFVSVVAMIVVVMGTLMYVIEGPANGYTSILTGIYWAATTMTTTGFGDITMQDPAGKILSIVIMVSWQWLPFATLIFVTALQSMDREQLEASRMDGAHYGQQLRYLYLPHLSRSVAVVVMIELIFLLSVFAEIFTTTGGGPYRGPA